MDHYSKHGLTEKTVRSHYKVALSSTENKQVLHTAAKFRKKSLQHPIVEPSNDYLL